MRLDGMDSHVVRGLRRKIRVVRLTHATVKPVDISRTDRVLEGINPFCEQNSGRTNAVRRAINPINHRLVLVYSRVVGLTMRSIRSSQH